MECYVDPRYQNQIRMKYDKIRLSEWVTNTWLILDTMYHHVQYLFFAVTPG